MSGKLLLVEQHRLVGDGLTLALTARSWDVVLTTSASPAEVAAQAQEVRPDCVLVDVHLGGVAGNGLDIVAPVSATGAPVVVLTAERRRLLLAEFLEAGAKGWISKAVVLDDLHGSLAEVTGGRSIIGRTERAALLEELRRERAGSMHAASPLERLTHREAIVLATLIDGFSAEEIAQLHFVAVTTVRSQIRGILRKLGVRSQLAAVAMAVPHRHLLPDGSHAARDRRRALLSVVPASGRVAS